MCYLCAYIAPRGDMARCRDQLTAKPKIANVPGGGRMPDYCFLLFVVILLHTYIRTYVHALHYILIQRVMRKCRIYKKNDVRTALSH